MKTLILIFIIWTIIKALTDRVRDRSPVPLPQSREDESPAYRLPPELREKWGPQTGRAKNKQQPSAPVLNRSPEQPQKYKVAEIKERKKPVVENAPGNEESKQAVPFEEPAACDTHDQAVWHLNPAMLKNGIVLSEILGPPAARRRRNRVCH